LAARLRERAIEAERGAGSAAAVTHSGAALIYVWRNSATLVPDSVRGRCGAVVSQTVPS
jgi:hypothetical protein